MFEFSIFQMRGVQLFLVHWFNFFYVLRWLVITIKGGEGRDK